MEINNKALPLELVAEMSSKSACPTKPLGVLRTESNKSERFRRPVGQRDVVTLSLYYVCAAVGPNQLVFVFNASSDFGKLLE